MQKQYFSQFVTGVLLTSFIAIPALAAQGGFSAEKEPVVTEHMYAGHKVQQENSQSRIQIVSSMHEGRGSHWKAMLSASSRTSGIRSATQPVPSKSASRRKSGTGSTSMLRTGTGQWTGKP